MRKTGVKWALLGALTGAALLAGCGGDYDVQRSEAMMAQDDYIKPHLGDPTSLRRGLNTGLVLPRLPGVPAEPSVGDYRQETLGTGGAGGAGMEQRTAGGAQAQGDLWLKQDQRVPYPPPQLSALVAMDLGTGKPLRAVHGVWVQGTQGLELGSGLAQSVAPSSGSYQPQEWPLGNVGLPKESH